MDLKIDVLNLEGVKVGTIDLDPEIFGAPRNADIVHQVVRWQRAKKHAGTHQALTRTMMKRGNKKPFKQKGTGRARQGSFRSPLMKGGAVTFGPVVRSYEFKLPKAVRRAALAAVLTAKAKSNAVVVIDEFKLSGKTKELVGGLKNLGLEGKKSVIVVPDRNDTGIWRSSSNLPYSTTVEVAGVNVYDVLNSKVLLITKDAVVALQDRLRKAA